MSSCHLPTQELSVAPYYPTNLSLKSSLNFSDFNNLAFPTQSKLIVFIFYHHSLLLPRKLSSLSFLLNLHLNLTHFLRPRSHPSSYTKPSLTIPALTELPWPILPVYPEYQKLSALEGPQRSQVQSNSDQPLKSYFPSFSIQVPASQFTPHPYTSNNVLYFIFFFKSISDFLLEYVYLKKKQP